MSKVTKTEKILRKATGKWEKFLAECAFNKTINEFGEDDAYHFDQDKSDEPEEYTAAANFEMGDVVKVMNRGNKHDEPEELRCRIGTVVGMDGRDLTLKFENGEEATITYFNARRDERGLWDAKALYKCPEEQVNEMTMGERGMVDAQDGNPPSKIGGGNEEYMAAFNAVMKKMGKEPLPIVQPDQAYLDALQRGNLEERDAGMEVWMEKFKLHMRLPQNQPMDEFMKDNAMYAFRQGMDPEQAAEELQKAAAERDFPESGMELYDIDEALIKEAIRKVLSSKKKVKAIKESFQAGEFVYVVNGSLKGASGKILEPITTTTGEQGFAIELYSAADKRVFGQRGDEVIVLPGDLESGGTSDDMELYDIDERSEDDERDLEKPVKYGSGAELEFDTKAQKFYDRKRDMYIDDPEEEDNLTREGIPSSMRTTHSSDPEMDQVMDIAADMLELGARSRIPVSLVGVESALQKQGFDTKMDKGMLIVDDKYVIAAKNSLPASAQKISFTSYAADYLSNLQGEQQNLPM